MTAESDIKNMLANLAPDSWASALVNPPHSLRLEGQAQHIAWCMHRGEDVAIIAPHGCGGALIKRAVELAAMVPGKFTGTVELVHPPCLVPKPPMVILDDMPISVGYARHLPSTPRPIDITDICCGLNTVQMMRRIFRHHDPGHKEGLVVCKDCSGKLKAAELMANKKSRKEPWPKKRKRER